MSERLLSLNDYIVVSFRINNQSKIYIFDYFRTQNITYSIELLGFSFPEFNRDLVPIDDLQTDLVFGFECIGQGVKNHKSESFALNKMMRTFPVVGFTTRVVSFKLAYFLKILFN